MKAIAIEGSGPAARLVTAHRPRPAPKADEVLIQVMAAGVNRPDLLQRQGLYPAPPGASDIPGLEVAGWVRQTGDEVTRLRPGDRVCALVNGGGYAEFATAPKDQCFGLSDGLGFREAAGLPEALFTVFANVFETGRLIAGETLLIQGGTSGIGHLAIQMAHQAGARVIATASTPKKLDAIHRLGATPVSYREAAFKDRLQEAAGPGGIDVILDMVGAPYLAMHLDLLNPGGRLLLIAGQGGFKSEINLRRILTRRLTVTGSTLRSRSPEFKAHLAQGLLQRFWPRVETGNIKPLIHAVFPLEEAEQAQALMASGQHIGKIILEPDHG